MFLGLYLGAEIYWKQVCVGGAGCTYRFMAGVLSVLEVVGSVLSLIFLLFLLLPQAYFRRYFVRWFWWLFLFSYAITLASDPVSSAIVGLDRQQVVIVLGALGLVHAALFSFLYYRKWKRAMPPAM